MTVTEPPAHPGRRATPSLVYSLTFAGMVATILITPVLPEVLDDLDAPRSQAGIVMAASTVPAIIAGPFLGVLADRVGRRTVLIPCLAGLAVAGVAGGLVPNYGLLLVTRIAQGLAAAGLVNLALVVASDRWAGADRARVLGRNSAVLIGSTGIIPPVIGLVTAFTTWRWAFSLYGVALVPMVMVMRSDLDLPTIDRRPDRTLGTDLRNMVRLLRSNDIRRTLSLGVATLALAFGWTVTLSPLYADARLGLGSEARGLFLSMAAGSATIVALGSAPIIARLGRSLATAAGFAAFMLGFALIWAIPDHAVSLAMGLVGAGAGHGLLVPVLQTEIAAAAPPERRGSAMSLWGSAVRVGQTVGPLAISGLIAVGPSTLYGFGAAAALAAIVLTKLGAARSTLRPAPERPPA